MFHIGIHGIDAKRKTAKSSTFKYLEKIIIINTIQPGSSMLSESMLYQTWVEFKMRKTQHVPNCTNGIEYAIITGRNKQARSDHWSN